MLFFFGPLLRTFFLWAHIHDFAMFSMGKRTPVMELHDGPVDLQNGPNKPVHDSMTIYQTRFVSLSHFVLDAAQDMYHTFIYIYI